MSYYENRIKALEAKVAEMAQNERFKAIPVEAKLIDRIVELNKENASLKAEVERLTEAHSDALADFWAIHKGYFDLKAEVEQLKEGNDCLGQMHDKEMERSAYLLEEFNRTTAWGRGLESDLSHARVEISFLKADLERLRKAGDRMAAALNGEYNHELPCVEDWNDAKEGKPSA